VQNKLYLTSRITLVQFILIKKGQYGSNGDYISLSHTHTHTLFVQVERDRVSKHLKEQDLLLETARRNIQAELQGAISEKLILQKEL